uniref:Major facilitator superfamily (MFS) profile domain-containing protein n=1 Tax=Solanum lycopersicum TaxID=4081 RepID=A0A3Q7GSW1_SOLLC
MDFGSGFGGFDSFILSDLDASVLQEVLRCYSIPENVFGRVCIIIDKVREFYIAKREEDIGSYAGYIGGNLMLNKYETECNVRLSVVAQYGTMVVFNTLFGLSTNFWMAVVTIFLLGSLNDLLGPIKAYAAEIFREEYQALRMSTISSAWGIGLIIGPALGGFLAQETLHNHDSERPRQDTYKALEAASTTQMAKRSRYKVVFV